MEYFTSAERHSSPSTWNWRRQFQGGRPSWRLRPKITKIINIRVQLNSCSSRVVKSRVSVLLKVSFLSLIPSSGRNSVCCCVLRCPSERAFIQSNDHCWIIVLKIVLTLMWGYAFSSLFEICLVTICSVQGCSIHAFGDEMWIHKVQLKSHIWRQIFTNREICKPLLVTFISQKEIKLLCPVMLSSGQSYKALYDCNLRL